MTTQFLEKRAGIGPCMDVRAHNEHLYAIQNTDQYHGGRLCVLNQQLSIVGEFTGIGSARQIEISGDIAIVTARVDGLWIFDISDIVPVLLSHYQTVEYATGATLYANFALISCRQYGVEIVDISNPAAPGHVGMIRIGEVQSACVCDGYLYGGVWGAMNVAVVDIRDIEHPRLVTRIPLEGRGDGVMAWGNRLYAVTGQHRSGIQNISDSSDPNYGNGNGLTVFDITDPEHPAKLHREEFGSCYHVYFDMWKPVLCSGMVLCGCSSLGIFAYAQDTFQPLFHLMLPADAADTPAINAPIAAAVTSIGTPPASIQSGTLTQAVSGGTSDPVTGFASMGNTLYVCGGCSDLFVYEARVKLGEPLRWDTAKQISAKQEPLSVGGLSLSDSHRPLSDCMLRTSAQSPASPALTIRQRYTPDNAPVLGLCECEGTLAAACSTGGLHLLDGTDFAEITHLPTEGFCCDVKYADGYLAAALADKGILLCRKDGERLQAVSKIQPPETTRQLFLSADGRYLLTASGVTHCLLYDITDKEHPVLAAERVRNQGPLYGDNFATHTLQDGTILIFWHRDGLVYINPGKGDLSFRNIFYHRSKGFMGFGPENGCDTDGTNILYNLGGGYCLLPMEEGVTADRLPIYRTEVPIQGKITLCGSLLVATERAKGIISVTDISTLTAPKHVGACRTNAAPGKPICIQGRILIPAGHHGLLEVI